MTPAHANGLALLAALAWGLGNVSQKTILVHMDGFSATGLCCLIGAAVLWPLARREARAVLPSDAGSLGLALKVAAAFGVAATLMQFGYGHTSVTNAGFMANTSAVITPAIAWTCFRQRLPLLIWPACLCSLLGIFLMAGSSWTGLAFGDVLCLLSAICFSCWSLLLGQHVMRYRRPNRLTMVQLLLCGVACMMLSALTYGLPGPHAIVAALPELIVLGLLSKGLAYVLNAVAQQYITATCASVFMSAEAVFGGAAAMILLGETLSPERAVGACFIIAGVVIISCLPASVPAPQASEHLRP